MQAGPSLSGLGTGGGGDKNPWNNPQKSLKEPPPPTIERKKTQTEIALELVLQGCTNLTTAANAQLRKSGHDHSSDEFTVCFMWKLRYHLGRYSVVRFSACSGAGDPSAVRSACQVDLDKVTICAEENLLSGVEDPKAFKISAAYDKKHGWKSACLTGCSKILRTYDILDLVACRYLTTDGRVNQVTRPPVASGAAVSRGFVQSKKNGSSSGSKSSSSTRRRGRRKRPAKSRKGGSKQSGRGSGKGNG